MDDQAIADLIDSQVARTSLAQAFYTNKNIYQREIEEVYLKCWLYAGHLSEIPRVGDWFLFEMAGESVIIVRSGDAEVSALLNVCRHRGSKICLKNPSPKSTARIVGIPFSHISKTTSGCRT